jgi:hypothetical protein
MTSLRADAESLAQLILATSNDYGPAISAFYQKLDDAISPDALNEAAAIFFDHATRPCPVEREVNLYLISGTLVEHGADPEIGWDHLQSRLRRCLMVLANDADQLKMLGVDLDTGEPSADLGGELCGWVRIFRYLVIAAMARLARRPEIRLQARNTDRVLVDSVWQVEQKLPSTHGHYLSEVLNVLDARVLIVDVISQKIEILQVQAVRNCAHLMALLDGADARRLGSTPGANYEFRHHYASFGCLDEETAGFFNRKKRLKDADWMFMLGVELSAQNIPIFDVPGLGPLRIIVRAPKRLGSRSILTSDFFAPIHDELIETIVPERSFSAEERARIATSIADAARALRQSLGRTDGNAPFLPGQMQNPVWLSHWNPPTR